MNKLFYPRLAVQNLRKNKTIYFPYLLASSLTVALYYILRSITVMVADSEMKVGAAIGAILSLSAGISAFLSVLILFYINSFVIRRRKKEFGLYSILGMEKRHIALVMLWEVLLTALLSLVCGIGGGALLSQLLFLILLKLVKLPAALTFQIPVSSIGYTALLYTAVFGLVLLYDMIVVRRSQPITLLTEAKAGEREPRSRWLLALIGLAALGGGYGLALSTRQASDIVSVFLLAVLLVITGTYALFIAGSIGALKLMRKNKFFYYKPQNFIPVSGMIYRMKQNAAGLASICILSTAVLVTMSSTVCLFIGEEDVLRQKNPREITVSCFQTDTDERQLLRETAEEYAASYGFQVKNYLSYQLLSTALYRQDKELNAVYDENGKNGSYCAVEVISADDYSAVTGQQLTVQPGTLLFWDGQGSYAAGDRLKIAGEAFTAAAALDTQPLPESLDNGLLLVVESEETLLQLRQRINDQQEENIGSLSCKSYYDIEDGGASREAYYAGMRDAYNEKVSHLRFVNNIEASRRDFYQVYGSLFFVGIFFTILFLAVTALIIYYKQITEGYDDRSRFQIMRSVGMTDREIRSAVSKQVQLVFFLPLGTAALHIAVAFPSLFRLLNLIGMYNLPLFIVCLAATVLLFALFYGLVYQMTARIYFKIVYA